MQPLMSIVIANYNYGRFLETAIQSVLVQCESVSDGVLKLPSGDEIELIIVDGGSTDNSLEIIKKYENRLAWWCSEPDRGQSHAFNKGFAKAKGRFLTWLNADDVLVPGGLVAVVLQIKKHPFCRWFVGSCLWLDKDLKIKKLFVAHRFSKLRAKFGTLSASGPSSFFEKNLLQEVGGVDETLNYCMDTDLWYKFFLKCGQAYKRTIKPVWGFRYHLDSKVSGADVDPTCKAAAYRRSEHFTEGRFILEKYEKDKRMIQIIDLVTISLIDKIISLVLWFYCKNKLYNSVLF